MIGIGHVVSVGWVVWKKADRGEHLFVIKITTGLTYNNGWTALRAVQSGEAPKGQGRFRQQPPSPLAGSLIRTPGMSTGGGTAIGGLIRCPLAACALDPA